MLYLDKLWGGVLEVDGVSRGGAEVADFEVLVLAED